MRARGHVAGGLVAGGVVAGAAGGLGHVPGPGHPLWWGVFATTLFFALFPDVDTDSLPRRWFYRAVLAALLWLAWTARWQLATGLAVLSTLPLVDHHRGWTHGRLTPMVVPALLAAAYLWRRGELAPPGAILDPVRSVFLGAAVVGWYTHLLLDGLFRIFPEDPR